MPKENFVVHQRMQIVKKRLQRGAHSVRRRNGRIFQIVIANFFAADFQIRLRAKKKFIARNVGKIKIQIFNATIRIRQNPSIFFIAKSFANPMVVENAVARNIRRESASHSGRNSFRLQNRRQKNRLLAASEMHFVLDFSLAGIFIFAAKQFRQNAQGRGKTFIFKKQAVARNLRHVAMKSQNRFWRFLVIFATRFFSAGFYYRNWMNYLMALQKAKFANVVRQVRRKIFVKPEFGKTAGFFVKFNFIHKVIFAKKIFNVKRNF